MAQSGRMLKSVPDPQRPGSLVEAVPLQVIGGEVDATLNVSLEDGAHISIGLSIVEISRIDARRDANGQPIYNIDTQGTIKITHPPERTQ